LLIGRGFADAAGSPLTAALGLHDPQLLASRRHAVVEVTEAGTVQVRDLGSSNGTWLLRDDRAWALVPPEATAVLEDGDLLGIGSHVIRYRSLIG